MVPHERLIKQWRKAGIKYYHLHKNDPEWRKRVNERVKKFNEKRRFGRPRIEIIKSTCELCNGIKGLIIHHINGEGRPKKIPDNRIENLITLCRSCHIGIHGFTRVSKINFHLAQKLFNGLQ